MSFTTPKSFFDELEAAAKGLSVTSHAGGASDLRRLCDALKASLQDDDAPTNDQRLRRRQEPLMLDRTEHAVAGVSQTLGRTHVGEEDLVSLLLSISKSVRALHGIKLAELGFHNGQDELLLAVDDGGITVSVVADRLSVRPSTVSKMMDRLEEKGLMERAVDARDGRRTMIQITPAGVEARRILIHSRAALEQELHMAFAEDHRSTMRESLAECQLVLSSRLRRLR